MQKRKFMILSMLILGMVLAGGALQPVCAERMVLMPSLDLEYRYDDNYFKAENGEKSVNTFILRPGFQVGVVTPKSNLSLSYFFDVNEYSGEAGIDDYDYVGHLAKLNLGTQATPRLAVGLSNDFVLTRDPATSDEFSDSVARDKYALNRFSPNMTYRFGDKFDLGARFTNLMTDYREGASEDSDENRGTFTLDYNFNSTLSLGMDYQIWSRDYDGNSSDYDSNQVMLVLKKEYKHLALFAGAGYHERDFDDPALPDLDNPAWKIGLKGQTGSTDEGTSRSWMNLSLDQNYNDAGSGDAYYKATKLSFQAGHLLMDRLGLTLKGMYQNSDYEYSSREDDKWSLACRANYQINRMFSFAIEPGIESRDSNFAGKDYDNSYILFNGKVQYDLGGR